MGGYDKGWELSGYRTTSTTGARIRHRTLDAGSNYLIAVVPIIVTLGWRGRWWMMLPAMVVVGWWGRGGPMSPVIPMVRRRGGRVGPPILAIFRRWWGGRRMSVVPSRGVWGWWRTLIRGLGIDQETGAQQGSRQCANTQCFVRHVKTPDNVGCGNKMFPKPTLRGDDASRKELAVRHRPP